MKGRMRRRGTNGLPDECAALAGVGGTRRAAFLTCVAFVGVEPNGGGSLRTGAGVATRSEQTEVAAHVLARVGH